MGYDELAPPLAGEEEITLPGDEFAAAVQPVVLQDEGQGID